MDGENLAADFNELNGIAHQILSKVGDELGSTKADLNAALLESKRLHDETNELTATNKNLSDNLAEALQKLNDMEKKRDSLLEEIFDLTAKNQRLLEELRGVQAELDSDKEKLAVLREKMAQVQSILAR